MNRREFLSTGIALPSFASLISTGSIPQAKLAISEWPAPGLQLFTLLNSEEIMGKLGNNRQGFAWVRQQDAIIVRTCRLWDNGRLWGKILFKQTELNNDLEVTKQSIFELGKFCPPTTISKRPLLLSSRNFILDECPINGLLNLWMTVSLDDTSMQ
jgi:hypothetical protein